MKRRYSSIVLAAILGSMLLGGCGTGTTKTTEISYAGETISGQVSEVGENTIKMEVDDSEEETTITVDDDTEITKQSAGGPGGAPSGPRQARHHQAKHHRVKPHQARHHQTVNLHRLRRRNRKVTTAHPNLLLRRAEKVEIHRTEIQVRLRRRNQKVTTIHPTRIQRRMKRFLSTTFQKVIIFLLHLQRMEQ